MHLSSSAFKDQSPIPPLYSGEGKGISPPLGWEGAPKETVSFALICDDPDAPHGTFTHWVLYNIPSTQHSLPEGLSVYPHGMTAPMSTVHPSLKEGVNSSGTSGYIGPTPPSGTHRYFFTVYALDTHVDLPQGATKADLLQAIQGHILSQAVLMGHFAHGRGGL